MSNLSGTLLNHQFLPNVDCGRRPDEGASCVVRRSTGQSDWDQAGVHDRLLACSLQLNVNQDRQLVSFLRLQHQR